MNLKVLEALAFLRKAVVFTFIMSTMKVVSGEWRLS